MALKPFHNAAVIALAAAACVLAAPRWYALESPTFDIITDTSPGRARQIAQVLAEVRAAWGVLEQPLPAVSPAIGVFLFRGESDFRRFVRNPSNRGISQQGVERDYIVLLDGGDVARAARHEFVHLAIQRSEPWPRWMEEGLAEYYSSLEFAQGRARLGGEVPARMQALKGASWLSPSELLSGPAARVSEALFYAQSWALTTWLRQSGRWKSGVPEYLRARRQQGDEAAAFAVGFRQTAADALLETRALVSLRRFQPVSFEMSVPAAAQEAQPLAEDRRLALLAGLTVALDRPDLARGYAGQLAALKSAGPEVAVSLGLLALQLGDFTGAEREFRRAIDAGTRTATAHYELATLLRDRHAPEAEVTALLERAVLLNPGFGDGWFLLGRMRAAGQKWAEAAEDFERAAGLQPRRGSFWNELADVRLRLGQRERAREAALSGAAAARNQEEAEVARGLLRLIDSPVPKPAGLSKPAPAEAKPSVEGLLVFVDCAGKGVELHIMAGSRRWILTLSGRLREAREFTCGPQRNTPVRAEYIARPDLNRKVDGEVTAIDFR